MLRQRKHGLLLCVILVCAGLMWMVQVRILQGQQREERRRARRFRHGMMGMGRHVNLLDTTTSGGRRKHKETIETSDGRFEVTDSGMLRKVVKDNDSNPKKVPKLPIWDDSGVQKSSNTSYAPTGGKLPKASNMALFGPQTVSWEKVDNFTCIGKDLLLGKPVPDWETQVLPRVIVLGTMKGGTQAMTHYLWQHKAFCAKDKGMEIHFFNNYDFEATSSGIPVVWNRRRYANRIQKSHENLFVDPMTRTVVKPNLWTLDSTPYYLMGTDRVPQGIACVVPRAKLIALLRNPVSRAESHYRYLNEARFKNQKPMVDWDVWVHHDIQLLKDAGVLRDWTLVDFDQFAGSHEEYQAWRRYLGYRHNSQQIIGRGLYAIQLAHYYQVMKRVGKPVSDLLVLSSEALRSNTTAKYRDVLRFLNLPLRDLQDSGVRHETQSAGASAGSAMPPNIRKELQELFRPYNQRLFKMLNWSSDEPMWQDV